MHGMMQYVMLHGKLHDKERGNLILINKYNIIRIASKGHSKMLNPIARIVICRSSSVENNYFCSNGSIFIDNG